MHTLRIRLNNRDLLWTAPYPVAWLAWDLYTDVQAEHYAGLTVSGAIEVNPGEHDMVDWLVFHPLSSNDKLEFQITELPGSAPFVARRTAAQRRSCAKRSLPRSGLASLMRPALVREFGAARRVQWCSRPQAGLRSRQLLLPILTSSGLKVFGLRRSNPINGASLWRQFLQRV